MASDNDQAGVVLRRGGDEAIGWMADVDNPMRAAVDLAGGVAQMLEAIGGRIDSLSWRSGFEDAHKDEFESELAAQAARDPCRARADCESSTPQMIEPVASSFNRFHPGSCV